MAGMRPRLLLAAGLIIGSACTPGLYRRDVTASVSGPTSVQVGQTVQLNVTLQYSDGSSKLLSPSTSASVDWTTSNAAVATVLRGTVTGVAPGTATITATPALTATGTGERIPGTHQITVH